MKIYINGIKLENCQYTLILVKELSKSHYGRLIISYAPYIRYNNIANDVAINAMRLALDCSEKGCWFVYDISIKEQDQLHFSAIVVDKENTKIYYGTSQDRSLEWNSLVDGNLGNLNKVKYKIQESSIYNIFISSLQTKPFLLLAGISGTGKSRIVREMAYMSCPKVLQDKDGTMPGNYCMVEVKPNWHDSTDLLGYYSNIRGKYIFTPFVKFLIKAMKYPDVPFFICLDEMNLAPVEQYFAEFLSVLETRKANKSGKIFSAPIIKKDFFNVLEKEYTSSVTDGFFPVMFHLKILKWMQI